MIAALSVLILSQIATCPTDAYPAKAMYCADPVLCDFTLPKEMPESTAGEREAWGSACQAYALMPDGWTHATPARGLFVVGRLFPPYALSWPGADGGSYGAGQAFEEGKLGHLVLGISSAAELWGCGDEHLTRLDPAALKAAGVCIDSTGALVANPWWRLARSQTNVGTHSLLRRCDGVEHFVFSGLESNALGLSEDQWQESGVLAEQLLEPLRRVEGHELVCITPELAAERRASLLAVASTRK